MRPDIKKPEQKHLNTLSSISALYLYTNPPPFGTGSPAPKVAETVLRSYNFNLKENKKVKIDKFEIDNPVWTEGPFPIDEISSNFHAKTLHDMTKDFLENNFASIKKCAENTINYTGTLNSDELTKGRQTWCPLNESSVPCAQAYMAMCELLVANGYPDHHTLLGFIQHFISLMHKDTIVTKVVKYVYKETTKIVNNQVLKVRVKEKKIVEKQLNGEEVFYHVADLLRSFCSYIKSGERAHLDRRAIASPNCILRAFFFVIEHFHLELGKLIEGSTISIGGEQKKVKIANTMAQSQTDVNANIVLQATQDATKWNECLSPLGFGLFSETLFNDDVRREMRLPLMTVNERLFGAICRTAHFILSIKMITLGPGLQAENELYRGELSFIASNLEKFNEKTRQWFKEIIPYRYGNNYVVASGGMLMGMHNALSTTYGLVSVGYGAPPTGKIFTLRSSDDSMTMYSGPNVNVVATLIGQERVNLRLIGINLSGKKTMIFKGGFGEYTSWYQDSMLVSQYGTETTKLRPGGSNPPDDFYAIAKSTAVSLMNLESNTLGAEVRIRLGIENVRSLYRIRKRKQEESDVSLKVRVLSDGGLNMWNCTNCHLEETSLKENFIMNENDRNYLRKIRDPDNPFSGEPKEEVTWSKESGTLTVDYLDTPRTVFHFVRKTNSTIKNIRGKTHATVEKENAEALDIMNSCDVTLCLSIPSNASLLSNHLAGMMSTMKSEVTLTDEENQKFNEAMSFLKQGKDDSEEYLDETNIYDDL
nr:MAG: PB1 [Byreldi virus]